MVMCIHLPNLTGYKKIEILTIQDDVVGHLVNEKMQGMSDL